MIVGRYLKTGDAVFPYHDADDIVMRTCDWTDKQLCGVRDFGLDMLRAQP